MHKSSGPILDSTTFHRRRKRWRRRVKSVDSPQTLVLPSLNNERFKFLLFSSVMNNFICLILLISLAFPFLFVSVHAQKPQPSPAGFLDFENLPVTQFSCDGKVIGGYYADIETGCQMFHVCTLGQKDEIQDIKFLCVNGTVFDQETRVCERVDEVDCSQAEKFFDLNLDLYIPYVIMTTETPTTPSTTTTTTTTTTTPRTQAPKVGYSQFRPITNYFAGQRFQTYRPKPTSQGGGKGYSSFSFYQRNPQSQPKKSHETSPRTVSTEYSPSLRQSYVINHNNDDVESQSTPTGRKVPSGAKPYFFDTRLAAERKHPRQSTYATTTTTYRPLPALPTDESEYYDDEYYDDIDEDSSADDIKYQTELEHRQSKEATNQNHETKKSRQTNALHHGGKETAVEETTQSQPAYYDDDYAEDYTDEEHAINNPNEHHFTHVDVPRIPYAKPNVPRVLVTNGKPFLPRLRRQIPDHDCNQSLLEKSSHKSSRATDIILH